MAVASAVVLVCRLYLDISPRSCFGTIDYILHYVPYTKMDYLLHSDEV